MRSSKTIHVISAHAEGEVGDVIVGGVAPPPRNFVLNEPRGGVFRHPLRLGANVDEAAIEASIMGLADAWESDEARAGVAAFLESGPRLGWPPRPETIEDPPALQAKNSRPG